MWIEQYQPCGCISEAETKKELLGYCARHGGDAKTRYHMPKSMIPKPVRLQYSRKRGARLVSPNSLPVVCVDRRTEWGNIFHLPQHCKHKHPVMRGNCALCRKDVATCVRAHRNFVKRKIWRYQQHGFPNPYAELRGKNLACWCPQDQPCHADILLEIANE